MSGPNDKAKWLIQVIDPSVGRRSIPTETRPTIRRHFYGHEQTSMSYLSEASVKHRPCFAHVVSTSVAYARFASQR
ncbi:MAG: hypothetical protein ACRBCJ_05710 [Hyphomicrobiaceae bacterium]